jgi:hypothetical protein
MSLERGHKHHEQGMDKYVAPLVSYEMTSRDYIVRPDATAAALTITLPPVAACAGRFYSIVAQYADTTNVINIVDQDDSENWVGDMVLSTKGHGQLFYSDGRKWMLRTFTKITVSGEDHEAITIDDATTAILISGLVVTGISMTGTATTGISLSSAMATGISLTSSYSSAGIAIGRLATELVVQASAPLLEVHGTSALTTGTYNCVDIRFTKTAAHQTGYEKALRVHATADVKTPGSFNAVYAKLDYVTDGYPWGDCAPISSELVMPNNAAIPRGLFTCAELQIVGGASSALAGGGPVSFLHCKASGTAAFTDDNAYLIDLDDVTIGDDHIVRTNTTTATHGIRILIDGVRYDLLCSAAHA